MFTQELEKLVENKELITIELDDADASEITGYLISVKSEVALMQAVGDDGVSDGFALFELDMIDGVFWGNREHKCIKELAMDRSSYSFLNLDAATFNDAVIELSQKYDVIALYSMTDSDQFEVGKIVDHNVEWIKMKCLGSRKSLSGLTKLIKFDNVSRVEVGSKYINDIKRLNANKTLVSDN